MDVHEGLDDSLAVQHEGRDIPSQEAPTRPSVLRGFDRRTTHSPFIHQPTNVWVANGRPDWRIRTPTTMPSVPSPLPVATGRDEFAKL